MSEDTQNSISAVVAVTLLFAIGYLTLQILKGVELPRWTLLVALGLSLLNLVIIAVRRWGARSRED